MTVPAADSPRALRQGTTWLCAVIAVGLAIGVAVWLGLSLWSIVVIAVVVACPIAALWVYVMGRQPLQVPLGPTPKTRGVSLDRLAPWYDIVCRACGVGMRFRDRTLALAALQPGERVLDVGCGTGVLTRRAAAIVGTAGACWGIDPAPDMIRIAQQTPQTAVNPARFSLGVIEKLDFATASVDVVMLSFVLHCLPSELKEAGLLEIHRVLRPGGRLIVIDLDRPTRLLPRLLARLCLRHPFMATHIDGQTADLLCHAGFTAVAQAGTWRTIVGFWTARRAA